MSETCVRACAGVGATIPLQFSCMSSRVYSPVNVRASVRLEIPYSLCPTGDPLGATTYSLGQGNLHYWSWHSYSPSKQVKVRLEMRAAADAASALYA